MNGSPVRGTERLLHFRRRREPIASRGTLRAHAVEPGARPERPAARAQEPSARVAASVRTTAGRSPVLVADREPARRAMLLDELTRTMPRDTVFEEAGALSEVLERAPRSRIVILRGDLADVPAESLTRVLARRHPDLPIMRLDARAPQGELCAASVAS